jgi:CRP-like cAMP-binding protein
MKPAIPQADIESLLVFFDRILPLDKEETELIKAKFSPRLFRKRQYVLQEGNKCTHFYFFVRGCLRLYKIDDQGNTHILQFAVKNT